MRTISLLPAVAGLILAAAFAGPAAGTEPTAGGGIRQLEARAFAPGDGHLMYTETHWLYADDGVPARLVLYRCPDGQAFARKWLRQDGAPQAPDFELSDGRSGYREGVRRAGKGRIVFVRPGGGEPERTAPLPDASDLVIDAGFDAYIRQHWDRLGRGESDTVPFLIPSRLGALDFKVRRLDDTVVEGRPARRYRLGLASWIGFALPHIDVAYDATTRELLQFVGLANIRGSNGDNVRARIVFDPSAAHAATPAALAAARAAPLDGRCPIP
ncbi:MAG: hypothetical protein KGN77_05450 [Xanthomonadaceae bacterium]|nr:hypothetical protein [Xanthomonadaceae bacterium]MDE1962466.1 hypothetical protein [Xanthomonadaceae bacterium]